MPSPDKTNSIFRSAENSIEADSTECYKCDVCDISVRSIRKLQDHVNFSPLHKKILETYQNKIECTSPGRQRLIYSGSKLFWRINSTFEVAIYEDTKTKLGTIIVINTESSMKILPLSINLVVLEKIIDYLDIDESKEDINYDSNNNTNNDTINKREKMIKYILSHLTATKENDKNIILTLQKMHKDPEIFDSLVIDHLVTNKEIKTKLNTKDNILLHHHGVDITIAPSVAAAAVMTSENKDDINENDNNNNNHNKIVRRQRRHTYEDMKEVKHEFDKEKNELRYAIDDADKLINLTRLSLDTFTEMLNENNHHTKKDLNHHKIPTWLGAYNKISHRSQVTKTRDLLMESQQK